MPLPVKLLTAVTALALAAPAAAEEFRSAYTTSYMGLPIARSEFTSRFEGDRFTIEGTMRTSGVARIASEAGVRRVVLTHISPQAERLDLVSEVGRGYAGEVIPAEDGLKFDV